MDTDRPVVNDVASEWFLWCALPVGALLLGLAHTPLWLTMSTGSGEQALRWVLAAQGFMLFSIGAGQTFQTVVRRSLASTILIVLAWTATDDGTSRLMQSLGTLAIAMIVFGLVERFLPAGKLALRASIAVVFGCLVLT